MADTPPYTTALLLKLSAALGDIAGWDAPAGLARATDAADILLAHGLALVDPERQRCWIDEAVYAGALFRQRLAEHPPSLTLPQDLMPDADHLVRLLPGDAGEVSASYADGGVMSPSPAADPNPIPPWLDRRTRPSS